MPPFVPSETSSSSLLIQEFDQWSIPAGTGLQTLSAGWTRCQDVQD